MISIVCHGGLDMFNIRQSNHPMPTSDILQPLKTIPSNEDIVTAFKSWSKMTGDNNSQIYDQQLFLTQLKKIHEINDLTKEQVDSITKTIIKVFPHLDNSGIEQAQKYTSAEMHASMLRSIGKKFNVQLDQSKNQININLSKDEIDLKSLSECISLIEKVFPGNVLSIDYSSVTPLSDEFLTVHGSIITSLKLEPQGDHVDDSGLDKLIKFCPNLCSISISSYKISNKGISSLSLLQNLTALDLSGSSISSTEDLGVLKNLKKLSISNCNYLKNLDLNGLTNLEELNISNGNLASLEGLNALTKLKKFKLLGWGNLTGINLNGLTSLTELNLSNCRALTNFGGLDSLTNLTKLDLSGTAFANVGSLKSLTTLTELNLSRTRLTNLDGLSALINLTKLDLSGTPLRSVEGLNGLTKLIEINFSSCYEMTKASLNALTNLEVLNFSNCMALARLELIMLTSLTSLDISGTKTVDVNVDALTSLKILKLPNYTSVTDEIRLRWFSLLLDNGVTINNFNGLNIQDFRKLGDFFIDRKGGVLSLEDLNEIKKSVNGKLSCFVMRKSSSSFKKEMVDLREFCNRHFEGNFLDDLHTIGQMENRDEEGRYNRAKSEKLECLAESLFSMKMVLDNKQIEWLTRQSIVPAILSFGRPDLRADLAVAAIALAQEPQSIEMEKFLVEENLPWKTLSHMLLTKLSVEGIDDNTIKLIHSLETAKIFENGYNAQIFIEMLLKLSEERDLTAPEKQIALEKIIYEAVDLSAKAATKRIEEEGQKALQRWDELVAKLSKMIEEVPLEETKKQEFLDVISREDNIPGILAIIKEVEQPWRIIKLKELISASSLEPAKKEQLFAELQGNASAAAINFVAQELRVPQEFGGLNVTARTLQAWQSAIKAGQEIQSPNATTTVSSTAAELEGEYLKNISTVLAILQFGSSKVLAHKQMTLSDGLQEAFKAKVPKMGNISDFNTRYFETFGSCKQPMAITTYAAKIASLKDDAAADCLAGFISAVLQGEFGDKRYELANSPHLTRLEKASPGIVAKWKEGLPSFAVSDPDEELLESGNMIDWLKAKLLTDQHLGDLSEFTHLSSFLSCNNEEEQKKIMRGCLQELSVAKVANSKAYALMHNQGKDPKQEPVTKEQLVVNNLTLQDYCIKLAFAKNPEQKKRYLKSIEKLIENQEFGDEFCTDVKKLIGNDRKTAKAIVFDSDDPFKLLFCGDIEGSCQGINGLPEHIKGLLGYLMNGARLLPVEDDNGKMIARCFARLMWDGEKPVLFRDRAYPFWTITPEHEKALDMMAIAKAEALGISAYKFDINSSERTTLHSLGGPAPWEYSDNNGVMANGKFSLDWCSPLSR